MYVFYEQIYIYILFSFLYLSIHLSTSIIVLYIYIYICTHIHATSPSASSAGLTASMDTLMQVLIGIQQKTVWLSKLATSTHVERETVWFRVIPISSV